jgi:membrane protein DedA with SNARE-associated domain/membrane-associated phospholipid phosphatase
MNFIQSILPAIEHFHTIGYWIALLAALLETTIGVGLIIPGSTIILFMGTLAAKGYFDLGDLIWFAAIGAIIGDNINYLIGKKYGLKIFKIGLWFITPAHFKKGEEFFKKHGAKSIFIGRFIPSIKEVIPLIAGTFGMKRLPFMTWNILGAIGWSLVWILPGYFFTQSLDVAKIWLTRTGFFLTILLVFFAIFYILKIILIKKGKDFFSFSSSIWQSIKQAVIKNPEVRKFTQRHKKFFVFLQKRLNKNNFYGLPLTLLFLALVYVSGLFGGIIEDIINSDIIVSADIRVANLLVIFRSAELTTVFSWITLLGKWETILIFTTATILVLWLWEKRSYIIPLLLSIVGSEVFTYIGKVVFHRARPDVAIYAENSFSFPSGHATIAIAFYGFLAYYLIKNSKKWKFKINVFFASFITILLIGFSRLYLGVHYVSDVWGGYLAGAIWLIIAISLSEYLLSKNQKKEKARSNVKKQLATVGMIIISILLYIVFAFYYQMPISTHTQEESKIVVNDTIIIFSSDQLKYTETLLGNRQEPLSFIIVAKNDQQLTDLFINAGWTLADNVNAISTYKLAKAALLKESYPQAPMTPDFWNSEVHNFGFEKETAADNVRTRHHTRFWKTNYVTENGENIYVGTASFDNGIKWGVTHKINPDVDTEREFLFNDLQNTGLLSKTEKQQFVEPKLGSNFSGDLFFTDGKLYLFFVKE